ncbi:MAG: acyl-homoserine-lactone synthase [Bacteroidota bacterium]
MINQFLIIKNNTSNYPDIIESMHRLRYEVFHKELGWTDGLTFIDEKEYDGYDHEETYYIVHLDDREEVDFVTRIAPSDAPYYYSNDDFSHYIQHLSLPNDNRIWVWSRTGASKELRKKEKDGLFPYLLAGLLEFGLQHNVNAYLGLTSSFILDRLNHFGCDTFLEIGTVQETESDVLASYLFPVSKEIQEVVLNRNKLEKGKKWIKYLH